MKHHVLWESRAQLDRESIYRFLFKEAGLQVANATDDKFKVLAALLQENPQAGVKIARSAKQRRLTVTRFPFVMVYAIEAENVLILRVLHTSRKIATGYR